jgi:hypothetical protein
MSIIINARKNNVGFLCNIYREKRVDNSNH